MPNNTVLYQNSIAFRHMINLYKECEDHRNHMFAIMYLITYEVKPELSSCFILLL